MSIDDEAMRAHVQWSEEILAELKIAWDRATAIEEALKDHEWCWWDRFADSARYRIALEFARQPEDQRYGWLVSTLLTTSDVVEAQDKDQYVKIRDSERHRRQAARELDAEELAVVRGERIKRSARDFATVEKVPEIISDVLAAEANGLAGASEAGKSLLARDWALSVASGMPWMGHAVPEIRNVLWVASEGLHDFEDRFVKHPLWHDAADRLFVLDAPIDLVGGGDVDWLLDEYRDERPGLIVFDVIYGMGLPDDTGMKGVVPLIGALKRISKEWGAATLAIGHPKLDNERRFRGSGAWRQLFYVDWFMGDEMLTCEKSKIADKRHLTLRYQPEYPSLRWLTLGETLTNAGRRDQIVQADIAAHPADSDRAVALRVKDAIGLGERQTRNIAMSVRRRMREAGEL